MRHTEKGGTFKRKTKKHRAEKLIILQKEMKVIVKVTIKISMTKSGNHLTMMSQCDEKQWYQRTEQKK